MGGRKDRHGRAIAENLERSTSTGGRHGPSADGIWSRRSVARRSDDSDVRVESEPVPRRVLNQELFGNGLAERRSGHIPECLATLAHSSIEALITHLQAYIVDVLLGIENDRIVQFGHDRVSTFGIGAEHDNRTWRAILRQLIALRLVGVDLAGHGGLSIAPAGRDFLRDKPALMLRVPTAPRARRHKVTHSAAQSAVADGDRDLFQALRQKRTEMARAQNVPPYVIFHDKTLIELAAVRPASRAEMADVPGIGEAKLDRYGPAFLAVIAEHILQGGDGTTRS